jgi:PAT complex subunit CCDC47
MRDETAAEWTTYASGRNNVAFTDFRLTLIKRYNPLIIFGENLLGLIFESIPPTVERMEATTYVFDNKEPDLVPQRPGDPTVKAGNSSYDGFVWAVVNKRMLKRLREDRYDLSLTTTKDHDKLPAYTTVMSESAEVTNTLLTPELIKAIQDAGDLFDALIISDQPLLKPTKYVISHIISSNSTNLCAGFRKLFPRSVFH